MKKSTGVYVFGIFWLIVTSFSFLIFVATTLSIVYLPSNGNTEEVPRLLIFENMTGLVLSIIGIITSIGLLKFKNWARKLLIILTVMNLFLAPVTLIRYILADPIDYVLIFALGISVLINTAIISYFSKKEVKIQFTK